MRRVLNDKQVLDIARLYGVKCGRSGDWDLMEIKAAIRAAFPGAWLQDYQVFRSALGCEFGRWTIGNEYRSRFYFRRRR